MLRPTHATTTATTTLVLRMLDVLDIKELQVIEFQLLFFDNIFILLIIKSLKSRKNTWILHLLSLLSLLSRQNGIRIYLYINITLAHCVDQWPFHIFFKKTTNFLIFVCLFGQIQNDQLCCYAQCPFWWVKFGFCSKLEDLTVLLPFFLV